MRNLFVKQNPELKDLSKQDMAIQVQDLNLFFAKKHVLVDINMAIPKNHITAVIGQSGCGKTSLINCFNRMNDLIVDSRSKGKIVIGQRNINRRKENVAQLRTQVGMVFQQPNPFPMSVYENVCFGLKLQRINERRILDEIVEQSLRDVALWDEVKDNLFGSALLLSGGQQQRLVIARALALKPEILLLDEPTSALDPLTTLHIEELIGQLKKRCTLVIVTHNMQQAARVSDYTAFLHQGELIEYTDSDTLFTMPSKKQTEDYITGRYG